MYRGRSSVFCAILLVFGLSAWAEPSGNLLKNPSFEEGWGSDGAPAGWSKYGARKNGTGVSLGVSKVAADGAKALVLKDDDPVQEIGVSQKVAAKGGLYYRATAQVRALEGATASGAHMQMRFMPSGKFQQTPFSGADVKGFREIAAQGKAPAGTRSIMLYLYTHKGPTPKVVVDAVTLVSSPEKFAAPAGPWPPMEPPQYKKIKSLYLDTAIVEGGVPRVAVVAPASGIYDGEARTIAEAIRKKTGVAVPVIADDSPEAALPLKRHLIVLGNRNTNALVSELYNRYFTLLDLRYPGVGGYVVRSLHNPFGKGINVVFAGGSDAAGVAKAARVLADRIAEARGGKGGLTLGRLMDIRLGTGIEVPDAPEALLTWEDSRNYRNKGYFGWNSISKHLAAYYMTGRESHAREAIRLAFPDAEAKKQITRIDEERIENKDDPLAGPYHYNAHMMILYWDLVEESPVFSDAERLRVTNAFARQLAHKDYARKGTYEISEAPVRVSTRHGQWAAISNYCLGRYFARDYDDVVWKHLERSGELNFDCLKKYAWVTGEKDNLWWYSTSIAPVLSYLLLSGERAPVENGVLRKLMLGQEILISGRKSEYYLRSASLGFLYKAAYLLTDGRYLTYVPRTNVDTSVFRLGQSYSPGPEMKPEQPTALVGKWTIHHLAKPEWERRHNGFPLEESFHFGSYRSDLEGRGDYILLDGFNGASRNPYHAFAILGLRLDGERLLDGVLNQVTTRLDGMVEPTVAMNAALRRHDVLGDMVCAVGEVPDAAYCDWRRSLIQRVGRYALVTDELTFETAGDNAQVEIKWGLATGVRSASPVGGTISIASARGTDPDFIRAIGGGCRTNLETANAIGELGSHDVVLLRASEPGVWLELPFTLNAATDAEMQVELLGFVDRGVVRAVLDGKAVGEPIDHCTDAAKTVLLDMGRQRLAAGEHTLRLEVVGRHPGVNKCYVGFCGIRVNRGGEKAFRRSRIDIACCDPLPLREDASMVMEWVGRVEKDVPRRFFSLICGTASDGETESVISRLSENACALALPEAAIAVAGEYEGTRGDVVVLAEDHLYGLRVENAVLGGKTAIFRSTVPVDVAWDFPTGRMELVAAEDAELTLALENDGNAALEGKPLPRGARGMVSVTVPKGRHVIESARPVVSEDAREWLRGLLKKGRAERVARAKRMEQPVSYDAPALAAPKVQRFTSPVRDLTVFPGKDGAPLIAAVEGKAVQIVGMDAQLVRTMNADATIRMTHWWPEAELLLAGCVDEKVIAFDRDGNRRWVFISEMDPAVFRAAKQYWFKSAPGHEGIHGLFSGKFIDGKPQAFVGSACTLEIIDTNGKLVKRMPQFWGKNSTFAMLDRSDGKRLLLLSRYYSGTNRVSLIDPKTLDPDVRGFYGTPPGHTLVSGWSSMNRNHIFTEDLDGDGVPEVMSEVNGVWNRVTVWSEKDKALYNANFGPGAKIPALNIRDIDVGDLDGDGKKEIVVATWLGLVVGLDCQCNRLWSTRLASAPRSLCCIPAKGGERVAVGGDGGEVYVLDAQGRVVSQGRVEGRPDRVQRVGSRVAFGTSKGTVELFEMGD